MRANLKAQRLSSGQPPHGLWHGLRSRPIPIALLLAMLLALVVRLWLGGGMGPQPSAADPARLLEAGVTSGLLRK